MGLSFVRVESKVAPNGACGVTLRRRPLSGKPAGTAARPLETLADVREMTRALLERRFAKRPLGLCREPLMDAATCEGVSLLDVHRLSIALKAERRFRAADFHQNKRGPS
jgi:hypothetical protein